MKIGILGGTFDPIHTVHLMMAEKVREDLGLGEIWFMPSHIPPHKKERRITAARHRLKMVELSIEGIPYFRVQPFELEKNRVSYTVDTMRDLTALYPDVKFYFIIGGDMVDYLPKWYKIQELVELVQFVGIHRPGFEPVNPLEKNHVIFVPFPQMDISSTLIRERIRNHQSIRFLVTEQVRKYIEEHRLYESG